MHFFLYLTRTAIKSVIPNTVTADYKHTRHKISSHEFRDLLKSTLLACGVRPNVADHVIGHKPKDSYEKQAILYPENIREEYSKASRKLNVFSNISYYMKRLEDVDES